MNSHINPFHYLFIILFGATLFLPGLGSVHLFDWDEINFAESAREMIMTGNYSQVMVNYQPFWEKPPLFIWMQVISMKMFGVNEFAARFPNAIFGILTLCLIYRIGRSIFKGHIAHWWVLCYAGAIAPQFYFKTGLIDPVFNFFIFLSLYQFYKAHKYNSTTYNANRHFLLAGIFTGIAILCKGPVALLIALLVLFSLVFAKRMVWFFNFGNLLVYLFFTALVSSIWFLPETMKNGPYFIADFLHYQLELMSQNVAGHEQPVYYHVFVLLVLCFPASVIAMAGWKKNEFYTYDENLFRTTMQCLFWVVLILFSLVRTKIVHYSSLCWLPLTFMAAYAIESISNGIFRVRWYYKIAIILMGFMMAGLLIAFPLLMAYDREYIISMIADPFSKLNFGADVNWSAVDAIPGILLAVIIIVFCVMLWWRKPVFLYGSLLLGNVLVIALTAYLMVPKVEEHTQGTAIRFFEEHAGEKCYIFHTGYKSYAPYFYAQTRPLTYTDGLYLLTQRYFRQKGVKSYLELTGKEREELDDEQKYWLIQGTVDRPVYFIAKSTDPEDLKTFNNLEQLWDKDGWVTFKRK